MSKERQVNDIVKQLIVFCGSGGRRGKKNEYKWTHQNHK